MAFSCLYTLNPMFVSSCLRTPSRTTLTPRARQRQAAKATSPLASQLHRSRDAATCRPRRRGQPCARSRSAPRRPRCARPSPTSSTAAARSRTSIQTHWARVLGCLRQGHVAGCVRTCYVALGSTESITSTYMLLTSLEAIRAWMLGTFALSLGTWLRFCARRVWMWEKVVLHSAAPLFFRSRGVCRCRWLASWQHMRGRPRCEYESYSLGYFQAHCIQKTTQPSRGPTRLQVADKKTSETRSIQQG